MIRITPSINCNGQILDLSEPKIMGILNVTPDSFYDGGNYLDTASQVKKASDYLELGAHIIDVGGQSTRPNGEIIGIQEEKDRVLPAIKALKKEFPDIIISIDTFRASVAEEAINAGASIINDVSGGNYDVDMFHTVARLKAPYILTHIFGDKDNLHTKASSEDILQDVFFELAKKQELLEKMGVTDIIIDPGFGFGKTIEDNYRLLNGLNHFNSLGLPMLVGVSQKSMIYKMLNTTTENALTGTIVANVLALQKGANILRVHNVEAAAHTINMLRFSEQTCIEKRLTRA